MGRRDLGRTAAGCGFTFLRERFCGFCCRPPARLPTVNNADKHAPAADSASFMPLPLPPRLFAAERRRRTARGTYRHAPAFWLGCWFLTPSTPSPHCLYHLSPFALGRFRRPYRTPAFWPRPFTMPFPSFFSAFRALPLSSSLALHRLRPALHRSATSFFHPLIPCKHLARYAATLPRTFCLFQRAHHWRDTCTPLSPFWDAFLPWLTFAQHARRLNDTAPLQHTTAAVRCVLLDLYLVASRFLLA